MRNNHDFITNIFSRYSFLTNHLKHSYLKLFVLKLLSNICHQNVDTAYHKKFSGVHQYSSMFHQKCYFKQLIDWIADCCIVLSLCYPVLSLCGQPAIGTNMVYYSDLVVSTVRVMNKVVGNNGVHHWCSIQRQSSVHPYYWRLHSLSIY